MNAELSELYISYVDTSLLAFSIYLTITFGFLVVAFVAGARLSRFQSIFVSVFYVIGVLSTYGALLIPQEMGAILVEQHPEIVSDLPIFNITYWKVYMALLLGGGASASLYFLYDIRRAANRVSEDA